jgi:hypothetical protein
MNRDTLLMWLVAFGFEYDAVRDLPEKSLRIIWACHK